MRDIHRSTTTWLARRTGLSSTARPPHRSHRRRLTLEPLEGRALLSLTTWTVNSLGDTGTGSGTSGDLRYVITQADKTTGDNTIKFAVTGTITVNSPLPDLSNTTGLMDIEGPGAASLTVARSSAAGTPDFSVFTVDASVQAQLVGLTITGGSANLGGGFYNFHGTLTVNNCVIANNSANNGGGILNYGTATVTNSTIAYNSGPQDGGGIFNMYTLMLTNCTIAYNSAVGDYGGGVYNEGSLMTISNSTLAYNSAGAGGGICNVGPMTVSNSTLAYNSGSLNDSDNGAGGGGICNLVGGTLTAVNDTIAHNTIVSGGAGGGLYAWGGAATLDNTIVAVNTQGTGSDALASDIYLVYGTVSSSSSYNVIGTGGSGGLTNGVNANQVGEADPGLGLLADNGGPTQTIALLPGSPAIDAGSNALAVDPTTGLPLTTDQRGPGFARIVNGTVDIGAFEVQATNHLAVTARPLSSVTAGAGFGLTVTAEDKSGNVLTSFDGTVTVVLLNNPGEATLGGTLTVTAQNGVATFSGLTLNKTGTGYTLLLSGSALGSSPTTAITVTPAAASQLVVTAQPPASVLTDSGFSLVVSAEDPFGNVNPNFSSKVAVALVSNPGGATLGGTVSVTAQNGVATFSGLTLNEPGTGYTLSVSSNGLAAATTNPFNVTLPQLVVTAQPPASVIAGSGFGLTVTAEDTSGNADTSFNGTVTVALTNNPGGGTLGGTLTVTAINGVATFSGLTLNEPGIGYTLSVSSGGLTTATTSAFNVQTQIATVAVGWGTQTAALQTASDGLRLLPAGRNTDLPWLGIDRVQLTLSQAATLAAGDITVIGSSGTNYGPVTVSGSGSSYTITLAQPINAADRVTITIGNAILATFTRRLDVLPGDVNDDGVVNVQDMVLIRNQMLGLLGAVPTIFGDINGDGKVDINDYTVVRKLIGTTLPRIT
ncbi:MAG: choice-of-anchor Q domain-containing protein [Isosphaeraceae bacterium]